MSTTTFTASDRSLHADVPIVERPGRHLRTVLAANAATSLAAGVVAVSAAPWLADELGLRNEGWTRLVGVGLVLFAIDVALVAGRATRRLRPAALAVSLADLAWVAATVVVLAAVDLTTAGRIVAAVMGIGVLDFALLQLWFRHQMS